MKRKETVLIQNAPQYYRDAYRKLTANLFLASDGQKTGKILFTSPMPGKDCAETAANCALTLANCGKKVLLIDADFRNPLLAGIFGAKPQNGGFAGLILKGSEAEKRIVHLEKPNLDLMVSGREDLAEFSDSVLPGKILDDLSAQYDNLLLAAPPVLTSPDAKLLSKCCDGTVLVLTQGRTDFEAARRAKEEFEGAESRILGCVLSGYNYKMSNKYEEYQHYKQVNSL